MRVAGLVDFRKFYRKVSDEVTAGNKTVLIFNNFNVDEFAGKKAVVLGFYNLRIYLFIIVINFYSHSKLGRG